MIKTRFHRIGRLGCGALVLSLASQAAVAQTAYFSVQGFFNATGDQYDFAFDLTRSVTSAETLFFETHTFVGGTNAAGNAISASGVFDSDMSLFDGSNAQIAQADEIADPDFDALISWAGVQTDPNGIPLPSPLTADSYRLNLMEFNNDETGAFAVDLVGPDDAIRFTGGSPVSASSATSLKFGSNDGGTATYNHSTGTFDLTNQLVVAQTGNANLNLSGGTITTGSLTTVNAGGTVTQTGGTLNANGGLTVQGGQYNRTSGDINIASGQQLRVQGGGLLDWDGSSLLLDDTNTSVVVSGAGSILRNNDTGNRSMSIRNGVSVNAILGGEIQGDYLVVGDIGSGGTMNVDGAGSSLNFTSGTESAFSHFVGFGSGTGFLNLSDDATATLSDTLGTELRVGATGSNGTVNVLTGADLTIDGLDMDETGTSTVTVNGSGSTITQTGASSIALGSASGTTGTINVENGGRITAGTGTTTVNATGTLNVAGGVFNALGTLDLQPGGTINLTGSGILGADTLALNGGTYNNPSSSTILDVNRLQNFGTLNQTGFFTVGSVQAGNSTSSVVIGNAEAITVGNAAVVGFNKAGHVTINSGGQLLAQSDARIGTFAGFSNGSSVDINAGGLFDVTGGLLVGGLDGANLAPSTVTIDGAGAEAEVDGALTILAGSTVTMSTGGTLDANGDITVDGGTLTDTGGVFDLAPGRSLTASNGGQVMLDGQFIVNLNRAVIIDSGADMMHAGLLDVGSGTTPGTLTVEGAGSTLTVSLALVEVSVSGGTGVINVRDGAVFDSTGLGISRSNTNATTDGTINVESGGQVNTGIILIQDFDSNQGTGTLTITGPGSTVTQSGASVMTIGNNGSTSNAFVNLTNGGTLNTGTGTTKINATGTLTLNGGNLNATTIDHTSGGFFDFLDGRLSVETFLGDVDQFGGTLAPGASAGLTVITGGYGLDTAGTLEIELGGIISGTEYDRVEVGNDAFLFGALDVSLINGFAPTYGDSFEFLTAGGILVDSFSSITIPTAPVNAVWSLINDSGTLTLSLDSTLVGDLNNDGFVGIDDLNIVLGAWNQNVPPGNPLADPSGDGFVGIDDLNQVLGNWNAGTPPPPIDVASIPEPASLMLLSVGGFTALRRW